jgi:hypothetical protein
MMGRGPVTAGFLAGSGVDVSWAKTAPAMARAKLNVQITATIRLCMVTPRNCLLAIGRRARVNTTRGVRDTVLYAPTARGSTLF